MLLSGKFRWFFRRRLRISLTGDPAKITLPPVELKEQQLQYPEYRYMDLMNETGCDHPFKVGDNLDMMIIIINSDSRRNLRLSIRKNSPGLFQYWH